MKTNDAHIDGRKYSDDVHNAVRYGYLYRKMAEKYEDGSVHACLSEASDVLLWLANLIIGGMVWDGIKHVAQKLYNELKQRGNKFDEEVVSVIKEEAKLKEFYEMIIEFNEHRLTVNAKQLIYIREEIIADYIGKEEGKMLKNEKRLLTLEERKRIFREAFIYADGLLRRK